MMNNNLAYNENNCNEYPTNPNIFSNSSNIRLLLHRYLYSDNNSILRLMEIISKHIDLLNIDYNGNNKTITIKIKKTAMKKNVNFLHSTNYYYTIFDSIMSEFFFENYNRLVSIFKENNIPSDQINNNMRLLQNTPKNVMYNLTSISDNIIVLYL